MFECDNISLRTSFKGILNVIDFDLRARNTEYALMLKTCGERERERERNIKTSEEALDMQCPIRTVERMSSDREENANFLRMDAFSNQI